jgi:transposase-like protein
MDGLLDLIASFPDEDTCRKRLIQQRWNGNPTCPHCGTEKAYIYKDERTFRCRACDRKFSVLTGTFMENTNLPLRKWFIALYLFSSHKKGISSVQLGKILGITQKSAWKMLQRIRMMMQNDAPQQLSGVIEADETFIGGRRRNKHKRVQRTLKPGTGYVNQKPVFGMLQRDGKIVMRVLPKAHGIVMQPIIRAMIPDGAVLITDGFGGYYGLGKYYQHEIIQHAQGEYVRGSYHTNTLECYWSHLKRSIMGVYHKVSAQHLQKYCDEMSFRLNTKDMKERQRFDYLLSLIRKPSISVSV